MRRNPGIYSWFVGATITISLLIGGNAGVVSTAVLQTVFAPGLALASMFHIGAHDLAAIGLVLFVNSIIFGAAIYGISKLLNVRRRAVSDKRS